MIVDPSEVWAELGLTSPTDLEKAIVQEAIRKTEGSVKQYLNYDPFQRERTEYYPLFDLTLTDRDFVWEATTSEAFVRRLSEAATNELQVKHIPIRSISSLKVDFDGRAGTKSGSFDSDTAKTEGTDFWRNIDGKDSQGNRYSMDGIIRSEGRWPDTPGSVEITYTAGYTVDELRGNDNILDASPIYEALIDETGRRVKKAFSRMKDNKLGLAPGLLSSERLGDYSYTIDSASIRRLIDGSQSLLPETRQMLEPFVNYGFALMA